MKYECTNNGYIIHTPNPIHSLTPLYPLSLSLSLSLSLTSIVPTLVHYHPLSLSPLTHTMTVSPSSLYSNLPILAIAISGILTTSLLLLTFYLFINKCHLRHRQSTQNNPFTPIITLKPQGLKPSLICSIPVVKFSKSCTSNILCTICLNEFQVEEKLRLLPNCSHAFHIDCVDTWLQRNTNCPLCRVYISNPMSGLKSIHSSNDHDQEDVNDMRRQALKEKKWSSGDECIIHVRREKDEELFVQPLRRSLSMDSSSERQVYLSVQEMLRNNQHFELEIEEINGEGSRRGTQTCFSFSQNRSYRKEVSPIG
ncbi:hypothetical protein LUZ60_015093 [Juncus effusus]|nr:hypothetical protein LUZ60_015093 [Juncus effusus]